VPADKNKIPSHGIKSSDLEAPALAKASATLNDFRSRVKYTLFLFYFQWQLSLSISC
jgi:hypothetical protein